MPTRKIAIRNDDHDLIAYDMKPTVIVLGDLFLDTVATLPQRFPWSSRQLNGDTDLWMPVADRIGGTAYHFARTAAGNGLNPLLIGCVGNDYAGRLIAEALRGEGIISELSTDASSGTGRAFLAYDAAGNRVMFAADSTANDHLSASFVVGVMTGDLQFNAVWVSGMALCRREAPRFSAAIKTLSRAREIGALSMVDIVPHEFHKFYRDIAELQVAIGPFDVLFSELNSVRRLLRRGTRAEELTPALLSATAEEVLESVPKVVLRYRADGKYIQAVYSRSGLQIVREYPFLSGSESRGYGDQLACDAISLFLETE